MTTTWPSPSALPHYLALVFIFLVLLPSELCEGRKKLVGPKPAAISKGKKAPVPNFVAHLAGETLGSSREDKKLGVVYWPGIKGFDGELKHWGGAVMSDKMTVHFLFYGSWDSNGGKDVDVVTNFIESLSDRSPESPSVAKWWDITTQLTDGKGKPVSAEVAVGKVLFSDPGYKTSLNDMQNGKADDVFGLVKARIESGDFPSDPSSIYVVMTSPDIDVGDSMKEFTGGFCDNYCGYHYFNKLEDKTKIVYAFVGNSDKCPKGCTAYKLTKDGTPNGFSGVDNSISVLAHELAEAASDPYLDGWYTEGRGWENGDVCAWTYTDNQLYPTLQKTGDNAVYNVNGIKGLKFLVQAMPDPARQMCVMQVDSKKDATLA